MNAPKYNPTCIVTGKTDNLQMFAIRDENGNMTGWIFLHKDLDSGDIVHRFNYEIRQKTIIRI